MYIRCSISVSASDFSLLFRGKKYFVTPFFISFSVIIKGNVAIEI